ncbi:MAG: hypothetical protein LQ346_005232 [Caloplaca aetnensis]|nr:MAG: hypothetical protein LQ346_005232 [Caloplaca aetnensis]
MHFPVFLSFGALLTPILCLPTATPPFPLESRQNATASSTAVQRAGGVLNPEAAAEANQRDNTATRAFSSTTIKSNDGRCLFIDPQAGDFRQNLIPVQLQDCDGSEGEKWDIITKGEHIDQEGAMLAVSTVTQGCLNFDPRRKAGDQVILFSCGGRADGGGKVTDSQEFAFKDGKTSLQLSPLSNAETCLVADGATLGSTGCSGGAAQSFTIG